jgi:hypothetical protein
MRAFVSVVTALLLSACTGQERGPSAGPTPSPSSEPPLAALVYTAVIRQLVTVDHTFGGGASPFDHVYVVEGPLGAADRPRLRPARRPFPEEVKRAIVEGLDDLPPVEFIADPDAVRLGRDGLHGVKDNGVIISLGPIEPSGRGVHVATGLWCGGLCGQWLTYVVVESDEGWRIRGTTGPVAIS